jgi:Putative lumazine-binding
VAALPGGMLMLPNEVEVDVEAEAEAEVDAADRAAILAASVDYIEAWLDGDHERMARCLHPELVKRAVGYGDQARGPWIETMTRDDMVAETAQGDGRGMARPYDASILDAYGNVATVRVLSSLYLDYLQLARFGDRWQLVNVLWQRRPI